MVFEDRRGCLLNKQGACSSSNASLFLLGSTERRYAPDVTICPKIYTLFLLPLIEKKTLYARVEIEFHGIDSPLHECRSIRLNAIDFKSIDVLSEDLESFHYDQEWLTLIWKSPLTGANFQRRASISYVVENPVAGLYFHPLPSSLSRSLYVMTDHETERCRYWLPCVDVPTHRVQLFFHLYHSPDMVAVANGNCTESMTGQFDFTEALEHMKYHHVTDSSSPLTPSSFTCTRYELEFPCPSYLICWSIGEFHVVRDGTFDNSQFALPAPGQSSTSNSVSLASSVPLAYLCPKDYSPEDLFNTFHPTGAFLKWMTHKLMTPFPFTKYYQLLTDVQTGAMENISLVTWGPSYFLTPSGALEGRRLLVDIVNIHEMAHSYFGDALVVQHFEHVWLKESWATYMEYVYIEDHYVDDNGDERQYQLYQDFTAYRDEVVHHYQRPMVTKAYPSSWELFDRHTYPGGSCRLHMLRKMLGDKVFWCGVKEYLHQHYNKHVKTHHFQAAMEQVSGRDLTCFFDQWFYEDRGFPHFVIDYQYDPLKGETTLQVTQTHGGSDDLEGGSGEDKESAGKKEKGSSARSDKKDDFLFKTEFLVNVTLKTPKSSENTTQSSDSQSQQRQQPLIFSFQREKTVTHTMTGEIDSFIINPELSTCGSVECKINDLSLLTRCYQRGDMMTRLYVLKELLRIHSKQAMTLLDECLEKEPFYGIRAEMSRELAKKYEIPALCRLLRHEKDPRALFSVIGHSKINDPALRDALIHVWQQTLSVTAEDVPYLHAMRCWLAAFSRQHDGAFLRHVVLPLIQQSFGVQMEEMTFSVLPVDRAWYRQVYDVLSRYHSDAMIQLGLLESLVQYSYDDRASLEEEEEEDLARWTFGVYDRLLAKASVSCHVLVKKCLVGLYTQLSLNLSDVLYRHKKISQRCKTTLLSLLHHDDVVVVKQAAKGLCHLRATEYFDVVEAAKASMAAQDHPWLDRHLLKAKKGDKKESGVLKMLRDRLDLLEKKQKERDTPSKKSSEPSPITTST